jgi:hypothetical protein
MLKEFFELVNSVFLTAKNGQDAQKFASEGSPFTERAKF